jgi:hypothetical protein
MLSIAFGVKGAVKAFNLMSCPVWTCNTLICNWCHFIVCVAGDRTVHETGADVPHANATSTAHPLSPLVPSTVLAARLLQNNSKTDHLGRKVKKQPFFVCFL